MEGASFIKSMTISKFAVIQSYFLQSCCYKNNVLKYKDLCYPKNNALHTKNKTITKQCNFTTKIKTFSHPFSLSCIPPSVIMDTEVQVNIQC